MRYQREMAALSEKAERRLDGIEAYHPGGIAGLGKESLTGFAELGLEPRAKRGWWIRGEGVSVR